VLEKLCKQSIAATLWRKTKTDNPKYSRLEVICNNCSKAGTGKNLMKLFTVSELVTTNKICPLHLKKPASFCHSLICMTKPTSRINEHYCNSIIGLFLTGRGKINN
jgi:hypothetical protein